MIQTIKKGFTLVELLIVIAILAVLAAAVIVVLNPGELLAQARDSQRVSDLASVQQALAVYISQIDAPGLTQVATFPNGTCVVGGRCTATPGAAAGPFATTTCGVSAATGRAVDGTGWVDVKLSDIPGGSPISTLPIDPSNTNTYFYGYMCNNTNKTFELAGRLESVKYRVKMPFDGGKRSCLCGGVACTTANAVNMTGAESIAAACFYETGTDLSL